MTDETKRENLVQQMLAAFDAPSGKNSTDWMNAALQVAADALLGPVTKEEWDKVPAHSCGVESPNRILAARLARLNPPPKTLEENAVELVEMMMAANHTATSIVSAVIAMLRGERP